MAIALGQPVEDVTHGLEAIKIDDHVRFPEKRGSPEVQSGSGLSPPDAVSVQAHHIGHEHPGGEIAAHISPSEASGIQQGHVRPPSVLAPPFVDIQGAGQGQPGVHVSYGMEQFPQHLYSALPQIYFQGPLYTGYPAQMMNMNGFFPYHLEGAMYPNPVVDCTHVYSQDCHYSAYSVAPYSIGYSSPYIYPQYQVSSLEHANVPATSPPLNQGGMAIPDIQIQDLTAFMAYGYQPINSNIDHGQWIPVAMGSPPAGEGIPTYSMGPYPDPYVSVHVQPPVWLPQPEGPKAPNEGDELDSQQQSSESESGHVAMQNDGRTDLQKVDNNTPVIENKKNVKKHLSFIYGPATTMPIKASWVRAGRLNGMNIAYPVKSLNVKTTSPVMHISNVRPITQVEVNSADFPTDYEDAKHFIIKSFSEENVHRSIQYGVWASTANGNKKLDEAFKDAQNRAIGKEKGCPVFLYFSVNGSGRFCGVAQMIGPVDLKNTMDFWERNRWCGSFPVKWHFIKDVPHCQLRRIILQNNENKPVTSSRDTQEVNFVQGLQMLSIIKGYSTKASILDNFPISVKALSSASVELEPAVESIAASTADSGAAPEEPVTGVLKNAYALRASNCEEVGARKLDEENVMMPMLSATAAG